ncbi:MAG: hypothetical protein JJT89_16835 [Nitriliruptoraceae bacterium]|nr:hypothetical protein [Nitriliruptoraceae bacterium]
MEHLAAHRPSAPASRGVRPVHPAVAATMRRVHAQLAAGAPPSFEALLAFGVPATR